MLYRMIQSSCFKGCCLHFAREHKQNNWNMFQSLPYTSISYHFENNHFCGILHRPYFNRIPHFEPRWLSWRWTTDSSRTYSRISTRWYPGLSRKSCMKGFRGRSAHSRLVIMSELISSSVVQILLYLIQVIKPWMIFSWFQMNNRASRDRNKVLQTDVCRASIFSTIAERKEKTTAVFEELQQDHAPWLPPVPPSADPQNRWFLGDSEFNFFTPPPIRRP